MNTGHEPTELGALRQNELADIADRERAARDAALELLPPGDQVIWNRDDEHGTVEVTRQMVGGRQVVIKSSSGTLSRLADEERISLVRIGQDPELRQIIGCTKLESATGVMPRSGFKITMPYVGLDLSKWDCLLDRDRKNNPFFRVHFHLKLAKSMLTALEVFHKKGYLHCDIKLNNWCVEGTIPDLSRAISSRRLELIGKINLADLMLIDLGFAMINRRKLPEFVDGTPFGVVNPAYVAPSYSEAVDAARKGDHSLLKDLSWKADLFSLGKMFEGLHERYGSRLDEDGKATPEQRRFLLNLPKTLCSFERNAEWPTELLPHDGLIDEIGKAKIRDLNEDFRIILRPPEFDQNPRALAQENKAPSPGADPLENRQQPKIDDGASLTRDVHEASRTDTRWLKSTVAPVALGAILLVVWSSFGTRPSIPKLVSRDDQVFAKCDSLRVKAVSGSALSWQDYSFAIGPCSEFLQSSNAPPDLRFDALITRAVAFEKTDRWHEALEDLALAESIRPKDPGVDLNRSLVLSRQGNVRQAIAALGAAIDKGWRDGPLIEKDADYDAITKSPLYQSIRIRLGTIK